MSCYFPLNVWFSGIIEAFFSSTHSAGSEFLSILKLFFFSCQEMGGYFIINGLEKVIRMLIMPRRNFPLAMTRHKWKNRGPGFTEYGKLSSFLQHPSNNCLRTNRSS